MRTRRFLTLTLNHEPLWVQICVRPIGDTWAARILRDDDHPPGRDDLRGIARFGETPEAAEREALDYLAAPAKRN